MEEGEMCNTRLILGIGCGRMEGAKEETDDKERKGPVKFHLLFPTHPEMEEKVVVERLGGKGVAVEEEVLEDERNGNMRKKLRLTKEQSTLLEDCFREHSTLSQVEKQELAEKLNLRPRQIEVWFQNRRARTKLKQIEVDCEFLKKCCESLRDENRRLKRELQELKAIKFGSPFYIQLPKVAATALTMCPSCERVAMNEAGKVPKKELLGALEDSSMTC